MRTGAAVHNERNRLGRTLGWMGVVALAASPALATSVHPIDDAMAAYERGDDATALRMFKALAEKDNVPAIEMLADMYYYGEGTPQDNAEGFRWSEIGARLGSAEAEYDIAVSYANGEVGPPDEATSLIWVRKAAEHGSAKARSTLANYMLAGFGVPKDRGKALGYLRLAAGQGFGPAMYTLGRELVFADEARTAELPEGIHWLSMAAEGRYAPAQAALAVLDYTGVGGTLDWTMAAMWSELAANQGCLGAVDRLAGLKLMLADGQLAEAHGMAMAWDKAHPPRPLHDHQRPEPASGLCAPGGMQLEG